MSDSASEAQQYLRKCKLTVFGAGVDALDLSELRIKFQIKRASSMTPNIGDIRVYNMTPETIARIGNRKEFNRVLLEAGYGGNYGVIFIGNIIQLIAGRESATDTFIDILAGDGDQAFNFAVVNQTIAAGATPEQQVQASLAEMKKKGVDAGHLGDFPTTQLPRGKVMYGSAKNYLRNVAASTDKNWSIQDGKLTFISNTSYLPGTRAVLTSKTGMIGTPNQTNEGVNVKCLLNPLIKIGGEIQIDNKSVERLKLNLADPKNVANIPAPQTADGVYYVLAAEHEGDTRGIPWYTTLVCLNRDVTSNPLNSVQAARG